MATNCSSPRPETETHSNSSDQDQEQAIDRAEALSDQPSSSTTPAEMKTTIGIYPFKNENFSSPPSIGMNHYYKDIGNLHETNLGDRIQSVKRNMGRDSPNPSEDEISVGCPSPVQKDLDETCDRLLDIRTPSEINRKEFRRRTYSSSSSNQGDNDEDSHNGDVDSSKNPNSYFKPLKKLKMMQIDKIKYSINRKETTNNSKKVFNKQRLEDDTERPAEETARPLSSSDDGDLRRHYDSARRHSIQSDDSSTNNNNGVKSFSILDILSHKTTTTLGSQGKEAKIVRPWDEETVCDRTGKELTPPPAHINFANNYLLDRNLSFLENCRTLPFLDTRAALAIPTVLHQQLLNRTLLQQNLVHQQFRSKSIDLTNNSIYESERSSSEKSMSTNNSNCTSPDIQPQSASSHPQSSSSTSHHHQQQGGNRKKNSPLDALFQMTNKTFDELNGENTGKILVLLFACLVFIAMFISFVSFFSYHQANLYIGTVTLLYPLTPFPLLS